MNRLNDIKKQLENEKEKYEKGNITKEEYIHIEKKLNKDLDVIREDINNIELEKNYIFANKSRLDKEIHEAYKKRRS